MKLTDIADDAAELLTRIASALPERLYAMRDAMAGQPGAQHFEPVRSQATSLWCWTHEREVHRCHAEGDNNICTGETILLADPTGEAAVRFDQARKDRAEIEKHLRAAHRAADRATTILAAYQSARAISDRAGIGECTDCHDYFDGDKGRRITAYGKDGTNDPVCTACRTRRDRRRVA